MDPKLLGLQHNRHQIFQQLLQVLLVGMAVCLMRHVVPALAEQEFGVPRGSFLLLVTFVVAFGVVKGGMNFLAGSMAERLGRQKVLLLGWLVAWPIPLLIYFSTSWGWIVMATLLLGVNQGLTWSMTQTSALDFTQHQQRGLVIGLNEFAGYLGVGLAGIATAYAATWLGARVGLLWFGSVVILFGTALTLFAVVESRPWSLLHQSAEPNPTEPMLNTRKVFALVSWRDQHLMALSQAGLVEKFVDALVWMIWPLYMNQRGLPLTEIGWVLSSYGITWGVAQLATGYFSDVIGRHRLNWMGMWLCGAGVALFPLGTNAIQWKASAALSGLGMAMLYPNLSAAVADLADPAWRATAIGIYRFWRDLGYALGALGIGMTAHLSSDLDNSFWFVAISMWLSGSLLAWVGHNDQISTGT